MNIVRLLAVPGLLVAAIVAAIAAYVVLNPTGTTVANPNATPTDVSSTPTPTAAPSLPDGTSGRITYRTGPELVTVQLPCGWRSVAADVLCGIARRVISRELSPRIGLGRIAAGGEPCRTRSCSF